MKVKCEQHDLPKTGHVRIDLAAMRGKFSHAQMKYMWENFPRQDIFV
jgi:hypothetical protein